MRIAIALALAFALAACSGVHVARWTPSDSRLEVAAALAYAQTSPSAMQTQQAQRLINQRCPNGYKLVEEGTQTKTHALAAAGAGAASTYDAHTYYWIVDCGGAAEDAAPQDVATE